MIEFSVENYINLVKSQKEEMYITSQDQFNAFCHIADSHRRRLFKGDIGSLRDFFKVASAMKISLHVTWDNNEYDFYTWEKAQAFIKMIRTHHKLPVSEFYGINLSGAFYDYDDRVFAMPLWLFVEKCDKYGAKLFLKVETFDNPTS